MVISQADGGNIHQAIVAVLGACERNPIDGLRQARAVVRAWPEAPAAHRVLAFALRKATRAREADQVDLEAIRLSEGQPAVAAAHEALVAGHWEKAEILIRNHLKQDPEDAGAAKILADIAARCGATREAEIFYKRSLLFAPGYHNARLALAMLFSRSAREGDALCLLDEVLERDPDHFGALSMKAGMLGHGRRLEEADRLFRRMLVRHPRNSLGWLNYAYLLKTVNRTDESIIAYRKAISLDSGNGLAWFGLANLKTVRFVDTDIAAMRAALSQTGISDDQRIHLHFALGKALNDQNDFRAAFEHYQMGNSIRRNKFPHDADIVSADVRRVERIFTPDLISARQGSGAAAPDPIFIVSLPRSGSTLIEQILASHPLIEGTEELYDIEGITRELGKGALPGAYLEEIANLPSSKLRALGEKYLASTRRHRSTDRPYFTDKMPNNWKFIGLIHLILPNAKIIDIRRHPLACGFANFAQHYNWGINFAYDMTDIGRFYRDYVRQMAHFDQILPSRIHRVMYEDLVEDFEGEVRRLLSYLQLPFDSACLRFFENKRAVHTPSSEQVRQPINRDGVDVWRNYEPWLDPLKSALGPTLELYPRVPEKWPD